MVLRGQRHILEDLWEDGVAGHALLSRYTEMVDAFISHHFAEAVTAPAHQGQIALIALGGYGRRELYPYSDIDLLVLHDRKTRKVIGTIVEAILYPLWDGGFEVGHSVREIRDALAFAKKDFFFQVALLDARLLAGSPDLFAQLLKKYQKKVLDGRRQQFVQTMEKFRAARRHRYGSHAYLLEPHIKEGKGGMRDIQSMLWVAKGVFGLPDLQAMEEGGVLQADERQVFSRSWDMLARIRNRLHYISGRKNDQLIFDYQEELAQAFGYADQEGLLAVELLMRDVYTHLQAIASTTDYFFDYVHDVLASKPGKARETELEEDVLCRRQLVRLSRPEALKKRPALLMRVFLQANQRCLGIHYRTRQWIRQNLDLIDDHFRSSRRISNVFVKILTTGERRAQVLEIMLETGLLSAYLPEFAQVESLAQHDLYHIYTVDRHQIQCVAELKKLEQEQQDLFAALGSVHVLYLAALLHDIGKGRRRDHSLLGQDMVRIIGARLSLPPAAIDDLAFLVRYHLYMPENALRRDLEDQEFIDQAAQLIGSLERLVMLYLLAIADSRATGPSAWSDWKATLLAELFFRVKSTLEAVGPAGDSRKDRAGEGVNWLRQQVRQLLDGEAGIRLAVEQLPENYLLAFTPEMVVHHLHIHRDQATLLQQKVLLFPESHQSCWSLLIMSRDRAGLLAKLCGVLALHNLSVLAAQIFTWPDGTVVDVLDVIPTTAATFDDQDWQRLEEDCNRAVNYRLDVGYRLHQLLPPVDAKAKHPVQQLEQKVIIDNQTSRRFTVIEVHGADRIGALYQLTQTLADFGLNIHRAKIATEVEQLIDIFYVTRENGAKVEDPVLMEKVRVTLGKIMEPV